MLNEILFALVFFLSYVVQAISGFAGNIVTEYERRFSEQGLPIYRLEAYLP